MAKYRTHDEFIDEVNTIFKDKIDFSSYVFNGTHSKSKCKCNICGHIWNGLAKTLLEGHGCPKCGFKNSGLHQRYSDEKVKETLYKKLPKNYEILDTYQTARIKMMVQCSNHHLFPATYHSLLYGHLCPFCKQKSILETSIEKLLKDNNIEYIYEKRFDFLKKDGYSQSLDFYLPKYNVGIECQGEQHFVPKSFGCLDEEKVLSNFELQKERDIRKKVLCKENGIKLVYFLDKQFNKFMETDDIYFNNVDDLMEYINNN